MAGETKARAQRATPELGAGAGRLHVIGLMPCQLGADPAIWRNFFGPRKARNDTKAGATGVSNDANRENILYANLREFGFGLAALLPGTLPDSRQFAKFA
jgi:hypothetical protein